MRTDLSRTLVLVRLFSGRPCRTFRRLTEKLKRRLESLSSVSVACPAARASGSRPRLATGFSAAALLALARPKLERFQTFNMLSHKSFENVISV